MSGETRTYAYLQGVLWQPRAAMVTRISDAVD
jgi:hypothetical protein